MEVDVNAVQTLENIALTLWSGTTSRFHLGPPHIIDDIVLLMSENQPVA